MNPEDHMKRMFSVGTIGSRLCYFNPVVSITSALLIWGFVIYAMVEQESAQTEIATWQQWVVDIWTWMYMGSQNIWIVVLLYVLYKYWNLKLGKEDEKPEFSDMTWFAMIFSCGVATGMWYYTAEAMWHYEGYSGPRWMDNSMFNLNTRAEVAIMVTWFHWGLHGWIPYVTIGALLSLNSYRRGFPLAMRWTLYPLIGEFCYGIIGDMVEVLCILCTVFGVCTSLSLGAIQINKGLVRLDRQTYRGEDFQCAPGPGPCATDGATGIQMTQSAQTWIIFAVTVMATGSVVLGLGKGIKTLAAIAFGLSVWLVLSILFMDSTWYILNAITSSFGYLLWALPKISFHTDAWEMLGTATMGMGGAPDDKGGKAGWMSAWTIFYWGWWISWGPFVGTFLARISRGRALDPSSSHRSSCPACGALSSWA